MDATKEFIAAIGRVLLKAIVYEAKKDFAKRGVPGNAGGSNNSEKTFFDSFKVQFTGKHSFQIVSDWPGLEDVMGDPETGSEGAFPMTWLTQSNPRLKGVPIPLVTKEDGLIFRMAPLAGEGFWIHPGIQKYGFVQRGIDRAVKKLADGELAQLYADAVCGDNWREV